MPCTVSVLQLERRRLGSRIGGGRSFQHREAANLNEPLKATERCWGVKKTWAHRRLWYLRCSCNQTNLSNSIGTLLW
ncbi:hypothetical protein evm_004948 [Chilo suppressalis]|nr:hypothetical protein evm_015246 [Chilo suppressalis]RVE50411.1 hypothetical protein evm_004948 [Chilo suppressalis]